MDNDLDLDVVVGLASLVSSGKGKPRASRKAAAPKPKTMLTPEQGAKESAKRKDRRHAADARDKAIATATDAAAQQQVTNARVAAATREALCMLGLNPSQHDLVNDSMPPWLPRHSRSNNGKCFNLSHCFRVIKDEEKFKAQYVALKSRGGKQDVEEIGDGKNARPRGKTNSKKEDKRDVASIALIATVKGLITKKDSRKEKRMQEREEQMNAFLEIQRRRLEMEAEKQARMLEMEAEKQTKMLEIDAANAKTKVKEVALVSMMTGVEIMKVDLNTVSPRNRSWFEKMQADMLKFDNE
ncbi:C2 domain-containing protein [Hordeum vulgare]|nr:C2 domain-containing protein [Hordeum vulgare]